MFGPQLPLTRKLWVTLFETLQIKWEVKYFIKKSSCVFFPACVVYSCVFIIGRLNYYCIGMYPAYICIFLYESADDYNKNTQTASLQKERDWKYPGYDIKQSDGEVPVMLELWEMLNMPSTPLLPGSLWPGEVASDKALSPDQIQLFHI